MPRLARRKTNESIYHVVCKSISEIKLLKDEEDKLKYIDLIKKYRSVHRFKIYCFCFMDNHLHLILDANGSDVSQVMHGINFSYARYFNKKYRRQGHLFNDRFYSNIVDSDRYLITASAYIHNNPTVINGYETHPENYKFSSLAVYLGIAKDPFELVDTNFVLALFGENPKHARDLYYKSVFKCTDEGKKTFEFENVRSLYESQRILFARNIDADRIIEYVAQNTNTSKAALFVKHGRKATLARALLVVLLKCLCNHNSKEICGIIGNITQANVSRLVGIGVKQIETDDEFRFLFETGVRLPVIF